LSIKLGNKTRKQFSGVFSCTFDSTILYVAGSEIVRSRQTRLAKNEPNLLCFACLFVSAHEVFLLAVCMLERHDTVPDQGQNLAPRTHRAMQRQHPFRR